MEVIGYKCFNKDMTNNYGMQFEIGKKYIAKSIIKFGSYGNGYHMCKRLEDTLRYFDYKNDNICICIVKGSGDIDEGFDDYNEYYDMYSVEILETIKLLSREEIINYASNLNEHRIKRFISCFKLTSEEIICFKEKFKDNKDVIETIEHYQEQKFKKLRKERRNK